MKTFIACLAVIFLASFQKAEKFTIHYPDFIMKMAYTADHKLIPVSLVIRGYKNGVLVPRCADYLANMDSVAIGGFTKAEIDEMHPALKGKGFVYTNAGDRFYARAGNGKWKKYGADKKLIGTITEVRTDTIVDPAKYDFGTKVYYKTK